MFHLVLMNINAFQNTLLSVRYRLYLLGQEWSGMNVLFNRPLVGSGGSGGTWVSWDHQVLGKITPSCIKNFLHFLSLKKYFKSFTNKGKYAHEIRELYTNENL